MSKVNYKHKSTQPETIATETKISTWSEVKNGKWHNYK